MANTTFNSLTLKCYISLVVLLMLSSFTQASTVGCEKFPQNPHQSKFEPNRVKVKMGYVCQPSTNKVTLTVELYLQRKVAIGFWSTVGTSGPQSRVLHTKEVRWNPNTLSAKAPCIDGEYRAKLKRNAVSAEGIVLGGGVDVFQSVEVVCR